MLRNRTKATKSTASHASLPNVSEVLEHFDQYDEDDTTGDNGALFSNEINNLELLYPFQIRNQKSVKNNPLCGICMGEWLHLLWKQRRAIDFRIYWRRILLLSGLSIFNSLLAIPEYLWFERRIRSTKVNPRPVFILGHPRTGTTLLHSLLALDEAQFAVCTTFCAGFPSCFLWFESIGKFLLSGVIDATRPMDQMELHFDLPQEDELATNILCASAQVSPYMPLWFMSEEPQYRPYYSFREDTGHSDQSLPFEHMQLARDTWTETFWYLLQKLTLRAQRQPHRQANHNNDVDDDHTITSPRLLLKSPVHTARIRLLLQLFPEAQFIYLHRHPYHVFRSAAHMADTTYGYTYLQTPSAISIQEFILRQYEILYDEYVFQKEEAFPNGSSNKKYPQVIEIAYEELAQETLKTLKHIYQELGWKMMSPQLEERLQHDLQGPRAKYQPNPQTPLNPALKQVLQERWGPSFIRFGYEP